MPKTILVVGSSLQGNHAPALQALGAHDSVFNGMTGDCYVIPVYELIARQTRLLSIPVIAGFVDRFRIFAQRAPAVDFLVTSVGCGTGGYQPGQIADLFADMPDNVYLQSRLAYGLK